MTYRYLLIALLSTAITLTGCAQNSQRQDTGMIIGGILGGALGNQVGKGKGRTVAIIIGTLAGAAIGGSIGRSMDDTDRRRTTHTLETVRTGVPSTWQNPDTGYSYEVTPTNTYDSDSGPCREYTIDAAISGKRETIYGTACRQPDGSWKTME
ncbi:MAG: glycine zipper 2TM domain-containing protein [Candidatus Sedimenticola sp. 20ELBAFRAG]